MNENPLPPYPLKIMKERKKVVCIGGGTGTFTVLRGLKRYQSLDLSSIVTMSDSGGSTGRLRNDLRVLPPGDVRQSLIALSQEDELMQKIFTYRFEEGDLKGHNLGNIILAGLEKITGSFEKAVEKVSDLLAIRGKVIPVTLQKTDLVVVLENGDRIFGEDNVYEPQYDGTLKIKNVSLSPSVHANKQALNAIVESDLIVIGPGGLFTSIVPNLLVRGIKQALQRAKGKIIYICNLMTRYGQTNNMSTCEHIQTIEHYLDRPIDVVLINNREIPSGALLCYTTEQEYPVKIDVIPKRIKTIRADLLSERTFHKTKADALRRSLIRHSSTKLGAVLFRLVYE